RVPGAAWRMSRLKAFGPFDEQACLARSENVGMCGGVFDELAHRERLGSAAGCARDGGEGAFADCDRQPPVLRVEDDLTQCDADVGDEDVGGCLFWCNDEAPL